MRVSIKNYQILERLEFEARGITVISGKSSNGKTSCYRAIKSCCLGRRGDDFIRLGSDQTIVALDFDKDIYAWVKGRASDIEFYHNKEKFVKTGGKPPAEYVDPLAIKSMELGKVNVEPQFAGQFDSLFVVGLSPVDAAGVLSFLFSGEKFPILLKEMGKAIRDTKKDIDHCEGALGVLESELKSIAEEQEKSKKYEQWIAVKDKILQLDEEYARIRVASVKLETLETEIKQGVEKDEQCKSMADALSPINEQQLIEIVAIAERETKLDTLIQGLRETRDEEDRLEKQLEVLAGITEDNVILLERIIGGTEKLWQIDSGIDIASGYVKNDTEILEGLEREIVEGMKTLVNCPYCDSKLTGKTKKVLLERSV